jgi:hypothetical protein
VESPSIPLFQTKRKKRKEKTAILAALYYYQLKKVLAKEHQRNTKVVLPLQ